MKLESPPSETENDTFAMDVDRQPVGKRRRQSDSSESDDDDSDAKASGIGYLRMKKARVLDSTAKEEKIPPPSPSQAAYLTPLVTSTGDAGSTLQSELELDLEGLPKKKKNNKKRLSPIATKIYPVVDKEDFKNIPH